MAQILIVYGNTKKLEMTDGRRKFRQMTENVGKTEILLKHGNKKNRKKAGGGNSRNLHKIRKMFKDGNLKLPY